MFKRIALQASITLAVSFILIATDRAMFNTFGPKPADLKEYILAQHPRPKIWYKPVRGAITAIVLDWDTREIFYYHLNAFGKLDEEQIIVDIDEEIREYVNTHQAVTK